MTFSSLCCQHVLTHTSEEPDRAKGEVRKCSWHWAGIAINQCSDSLHHYLLFLMIKILRVRDWERLTMALIRDCWQFSDAILNLCMYYEGGPWHFLLFLSRIGRTKVWDRDNELKGPRDACHRLPTSVTHNLFKGFCCSRSRSRCESGSYLVVAIRRMVLDCWLGALTSLFRGSGQKFSFWESWAFLTTS